MQEFFETKNYYEILEISPSASQKDIELAYKKALNIYSVDSVAAYSILTYDDCKMMREHIEEAFSILSAPEKRAEYNKMRGLNLTVLGKSKANPDNQTFEPVFEEPKEEKLNNSYVDRDEARSKFELTYQKDYSFENEIENKLEFTGEFLKRVREYKNMSLDRLSDLSKIMKQYLIYIENEDFDKLPATAYTRGFLFQYAKCLKLNQTAVLDSYLRRLKSHRNELH